MNGLLQRLVAFTGDGVYRYAFDDGRILLANRGLVRILDLDCAPEDLVGRTLREVMVYTEREGTVRQSLVDHGEIHGFEYHFKTLTGMDRWVIHDSFVVEEPGGTRVVEAIVKDITSRKQAELDLAAERERLRVTLRSIGDGVITTDATGRVTMLNPVAEALTGWSEDTARGRPLVEVFRIINEHTREPCANPVEEVLATGLVVGLANDTVLVARDGTERVIADSGAPIRDARGEILGVVLVFRDQTEAKQAEEEAWRAQKLESIGILAGGIAHDFNNILAAAAGQLSMARASLPAGHSGRYRMEEAESAILRARDLTRQLLTFARGGEPVRAALRLGEVLQEAGAVSLAGRTARWELDLEEGLWVVEADRGQLCQVFANLLINAAQAMPGGGVIRIRARNLPAQDGHPDRVGVSVEDEGMGIPESVASRIFDPYFTTKSQGSGLGLAVVYNVVRRHGGTVSVSSRPGHGARFDVHLPATRERAAEAPRAPEGVSRLRGRVLVMDDDPVVRDVLVEMLEYLGMEAVPTADGAAAIVAHAAAREAGRPFELAIMDLTVRGGMGGLEAMRVIRQRDTRLLAVVSSGYSNDPVMADCRSYGFDAVIEKPYRLEDVADLLARLLDGRGGGDVVRD